MLPDLLFVLLFSNFKVLFKITRNSVACRQKGEKQGTVQFDTLGAHKLTLVKLAYPQQ